MNNEQNKIQLQGVIKTLEKNHVINGEQFYTGTIEVKRLSETVDILPFTVSEYILEINNTKLGDEVIVNGSIRTYNKESVQENKSKLVITVFIDEIQEIIEENNVLNEVEIIGYVCKPPVYRETPFGKTITDLIIATNKTKHNKVYKSYYIPAIAWSRVATRASKLNVGDQISVRGRLQHRNYNKTINDEVVELTAYELSITSIKEIQ